jgi:hypothetical protein
MIHNLIAFLCSCSLFIHSTNVYSFQVQDTTYQKENLLKSLQCELKDPSYRTITLPNNFSHLSKLISNGNSNNQPPAYLRSVIKLFSNLLKGAEYVNASAFENFLETFPTIISPYFTLSTSRKYITNEALYDAHLFDRFQASVNNALYFKFSSDYESFKQNPTQFLENISSEILLIAQEEVSREQLRQSIIAFIEIALSKMIWDVSQPEKSWLTTKTIANQLAELLDQNIIEDTNDLDDLYWSLVSRYSYFITITATDIDPSFFTTIKNDISNSDVILF